MNQSLDTDSISYSRRIMEAMSPKEQEGQQSHQATKQPYPAILPEVLSVCH